MPQPFSQSFFFYSTVFMNSEKKSCKTGAVYLSTCRPISRWLHVFSCCFMASDMSLRPQTQGQIQYTPTPADKHVGEDDRVERWEPVYSHLRTCRHSVHAALYVHVHKYEDRGVKEVKNESGCYLAAWLISKRQLALSTCCCSLQG